MVFEFINKVLLPRTEKRTLATAAHYFVMEMLCSFEALNLPGLMLEHIYKTVIESKGVHGMGYIYFLTKVFKHFQIPLSVGKVGAVKQKLSHTVPWSSVSLLKEEAIPRERCLNSSKIRINSSMRLRSSLCVLVVKRL